MQGSETISESKLKTSKACFQMYEKWKGTLQEGAKGKTVAHYVDACIKGYPKGTKINPSLLKTRVNGIYTYASVNELNVPETDVEKANALITKYRETSKKTVQ